MKAVVVLLASLFIGSCANVLPTPPPSPSQFFEYVADCSVQECKVHCPELATQVVACLLTGDPTACLTSLLSPVYGITKDVVACVVRKVGAEANASMLAGVSVTENRAVANAARAWITQQKIGYR